MRPSYIVKTLVVVILMTLIFLLAVYSRLEVVDRGDQVSSRIRSFEAITDASTTKTTGTQSPVVVTNRHEDSTRSTDETKGGNTITDATSFTGTTSGTSSIVNTHLDTHSFPFMDVGKTWSNPFCHEFFSNQFSVKVAPCEDHTDRVICHGSPYDDKMGSCSLRDITMDTGRFYQTMFDNKDGVRESKSLWFNGRTTLCSNPKFDLMEKKMVGGDYVKRVTQTAILTYPQGKECSTRINGTTFLFMGFDDHIYFKYLSWFSLHNGLLNYETETGLKPSLIVRIPELKGNFTHSDYEQRLFPDIKLLSLKDFMQQNKGGVVCFDRLIITPWAYSTNAFRCKMADSAKRLRKKCYDCKGDGLDGTRFMSFRRRALAACSITDDDKTSTPVSAKDIRNIVLQIRKPYIRRLGDKLDKFSRVLENPNEVVQGLKEGFPGAVVSTMVAEDMALCDQLRLVHNADVLVGVHGAGLVHLWWLRDHALLFELVPSRQRSNPSFKMLSTLVGRRYHGYEKLKGPEKRISVDVNDVVKEIKQHF